MSNTVFDNLIIAALIVLVLSKISHAEPPLIFDKNCLIINLLYAKTEENTTSCRIIRIIRQDEFGKKGLIGKLLLSLACISISFLL